MSFTMICGCIFTKAKEPMDNSNCKIHPKTTYRCCRYDIFTKTKLCNCKDYRPRSEPIINDGWPLCVCGHIAQEHN